MGLKLHHVKALPKVKNELFEKNWLSAILLRYLAFKVGEKLARSASTKVGE